MARPLAIARPLSPPWTLNLEIMKLDGPPLTLEERKRTQMCLDFIENLQWHSREPISPFDENLRDSAHIIERYPSKIRGATLLRLETKGWTPALLAQTVLLLNNFTPNNMYHWPKCCRHLASRLEGAAAYAQRAINAYEDECRLRRLPRRCTNCEITHQRCSLRDNPMSKKPCLTCKYFGVEDEHCMQKYNLNAPNDQNPILKYPPLGFLHFEPAQRRRKRSDEVVGHSLPLNDNVPGVNRFGGLEFRDSRPAAGGEEHLAERLEEMDEFTKKRRISERGEFIYTSPKLNRQTQPNIPEEAEGSPSGSRHEDTTQYETAHAGIEQVHTGHTINEQVDTGHAGIGHTGCYPKDDLVDSSSAEQHFVDSHFRNFSSANSLNPPAPVEGAGSAQPAFGPSDTVNPDGGAASVDLPILQEAGFEVPRAAPRFTAINPDPPKPDSEGAAVGSSRANQPNNGSFRTGAPEIDPFDYFPAENSAADRNATDGHEAASDGQANGQNTRSDDPDIWLPRGEFLNMDVEDFSNNTFNEMRDDFQRWDNGPADDGPVDDGPIDNNAAANNDDAAMNRQEDNQNATIDDFSNWFS